MSDDSKMNSDVASQFVKDDFAPPIPFVWDKYDKIGKDEIAMDLARDSCKLLSKHSKYVTINHEILDKYSQSLNKKEIDELFFHQPHTHHWNPNAKKSDNSNSNKNDEKSNSDDSKTDGKAKADATTSEAFLINTSTMFMILQFGSGFRKELHKYCDGRGASLTMGYGIANINKENLLDNVKSMQTINTVEKVAQLFGIPHEKSKVLKSLCCMILDVFKECCDVLISNKCQSFAEYIYKIIDLARCEEIQSRGLKEGDADRFTIEFDISKTEKPLGLKFSPALWRNFGKNDIKPFNRTYVTGIEENCDAIKSLSLSDELKKKLTSGEYMLEYINKDFVFNQGFEDNIAKLIQFDENILKLTFVKRQISKDSKGNGICILPFVLRCLLNDYSNLNDQFTFKNYNNEDGSDIHVHMHKRGQLILMELYNNLKNSNAEVFDFEDIGCLTCVVDNVVPFVLIKDDVLIFQKEFDQEIRKYYEDGKYCLKRGNLEGEIRAVGLHCVELIVQKRKDLNIAAVTYYLWKKGKFDGYRKFARHYTRDTIFY